MESYSNLVKRVIMINNTFIKDFHLEDILNVSRIRWQIERIFKKRKK